jgi:putative tryptophan/tyrosine transport system substrate-binding protein
MRRRDFIAFLGAATVTRPLAAAPHSSKVYRVALVLAVTPVAEMAGPEPIDPVTTAFLHALGAFGYVEGQNLILERRSAEGQFSRDDDIIAELARLKTDVIVTSTFPMVQQARSASNTVPIVTVFNRDPVEGGLVNSLARPAGNITGFTLLAPETDGKRIELLKETLPGATRVAYLGTNKDWEGPPGQSVRAVAQAVGLTVILAEHTPTEYTGAFTLLEHVHVDALFVSSTPYQFANRNLIVDFARQRRLPDTHNNREAVERGALMSYGPNIRDIYRRSAAYVDKILKGAKPRDLPIEQPTKFDLVINLNTAKALGLTIPPSLLARADEVIE